MGSVMTDALKRPARPRRSPSQRIPIRRKVLQSSVPSVDIASLEPTSSVPSAEHGGHNEEHAGICCSNPRSPLHSYRKRGRTFIWTLNYLFWIESAFSLVALSLLVAVLLHDPVKKLKLLGISKTVLMRGFICNPADPSSFRSSAKDRCVVRSFGFQHPFTWHVSNYVVCSKCIRESNLRCRGTCLDTYQFNEIKQNQTRTAPRRST